VLPKRLFDRHHAKHLTKAAAAAITKKNQDDLKEYASYSSWTTDIWTGLGQKEMAGLTAHFWPKSWPPQPRRVTLDLFYFPESHTGENYSSKLDARAQTWGGKPFQMTTDKGANVRLGVRLFLQKDGTLFIDYCVLISIRHSLSGPPPRQYAEGSIQNPCHRLPLFQAKEDSQVHAQV
jgi:hypothetical protein